MQSAQAPVIALCINSSLTLNISTTATSTGTCLHWLLLLLCQ